MKASSGNALGPLVLRFMAEVHHHDGGRTLPILHASKLTTPQLAVLELVRTPRTVSAIADHVSLSRPATSQMVEKLVGRGLVRRDLGPGDRRERSVTLSPKGDLLLRRIAAARAARFDASLSTLQPPVARRLSRVLTEVVGALTRAREATRAAQTANRR